MPRSRLSGFAKLVVVILLAIGLSHSFALSQTGDWTFMAFINGDNNLESGAISVINSMEVAGSDADVNIVVQIDRSPKYDRSNDNWTTTRRYCITKDPDGYNSTIISTLIEDLGELNMGDPQTLIDFAEWAIDNYPAEHYALVIWDHGSGWKDKAREGPAPVPQGISFDGSDLDYLTTPELREAMAAIKDHYGRKLDIIGFDACLMGMLELDYELAPYADYRVGSEEVELSPGWDYEASLTYLVNHPLATARRLASQIVIDYGNRYGEISWTTLSAVNLHTVRSPGLAKALDRLATDLMDKLYLYKFEIATTRDKVKHYYDPDYVDLYHFSQLIKANIDDGKIQADAQAVIDAVSQAVTRNFGEQDNHGISIYFPSNCNGYLASYDEDILLSRDTSWNNFLWTYCLDISPFQMEVGEVEVDHTWKTVHLESTFLSPVVVAKPLSENGTDPALIRIRDVGSKSFQIKIQEWGYLDGSHTPETVGYIVMEKGHFILPNRVEIEAGMISSGPNPRIGIDSFRQVTFIEPFSTKPVVITSVMSFNTHGLAKIRPPFTHASEAVVTRNKNITVTGFKVALQREEAAGQRHWPETISYIAWEPGMGAIDGRLYEAGTISSVTQEFSSINFSQTYAELPLFLADMQTSAEDDTANLRWRDKELSSIEIKVDEEGSQDAETNHFPEEVGYLLIEKIPSPPLSSVSPKKTEPFLLQKVFVYPNPLRSSGMINFIVQGQGIAAIQVEIYDLSGRRIFSSGEVNGTTLSWWPECRTGEPLANGIYLYVITAWGNDGQVTGSRVQKLVILR